MRQEFNASLRMPSFRGFLHGHHQVFLLLSLARFTIFDPFDMDGSEASQEKGEIILEDIEKPYDGRCTPSRLLWEDVHVIGLVEYSGSVVK